MKNRVSREFRADCVNKFQEIGRQVLIGQDLDDYLFLRKIRNVICHYHIELEKNLYKQIDKIILRDKYEENVDFEIKMTVTQLREFALYISEEYLGKYFK